MPSCVHLCEGNGQIEYLNSVNGLSLGTVIEKYLVILSIQPMFVLYSCDKFYLHKI